MEHKEPVNPFAQTAHERADAAIEHARQVREKAEEDRRQKQAARSAPRLIADGKLQRCSVCGYPFPDDVKPSMSIAFADHLRKAHKPGQTTEDSSQAALRIVREATEDK